MVGERVNIRSACSFFWRTKDIVVKLQPALNPVDDLERRIPLRQSVEFDFRLVAQVDRRFGLSRLDLLRWQRWLEVRLEWIA